MSTIPPAEYRERLVRFQANLRAAGLDAALVHGNEADCASVRFLCDYWPTFESAAVFVPATGEPVLLIGPESFEYAKGRSTIQNIEKMVEYRESADPEYPGIAVASYKDVLAKALPGKTIRKLGIVSYSITPLPVYMSLREQLPGVELVKADDTMVSLRSIKSANEIACMKTALRSARRPSMPSWPRSSRA